MENRKGSGIFLGVIGVATLIVAIIGATFAFFGANAQSAETAVAAGGAVLALGYHDELGGLKYNLIPADDDIAHFAATNENHISTKGRCLDDVGNEVCGTYEFWIGNPSLTTQQGLYGNIKIANSDFTNLWFEILDEKGEVVVEPTEFSSAVDNIIELTDLQQELAPTPDEGEFDAEDPTKYPLLCTLGETYDHDADEETDEVECTKTNVRHYTMVIWIHEMHANQTDDDSGKVFAAGINFTSANDKTGVTGVIAAARENQNGE